MRSIFCILNLIPTFLLQGYCSVGIFCILIVFFQVQYLHISLLQKIRKKIALEFSWILILSQIFLCVRISKPKVIIKIFFPYTSYNSFNKWTEILSLEMIIFELKNYVKKWSKIYFEIDRAPSELLLPRMAKLAWQPCRYL